MMPEPVPQFNPQPEKVKLLERSEHSSIGFLKDQLPAKDIALISPAKLAKLKEEDFQIWIQRHFGIHASYSDLDYANAGADIVDTAYLVIQNAHLITKLEPLTWEEALFLKPKQIIITSLDFNSLSPEYFTILREKNITAFGLDFIENMDGGSILQDIFFRAESPIAITLSLSNFILPLLYTLGISTHLRGTIQANPALFQSLYCYKGEITKREIAEPLNLPWRDFLSQYWNLN